MDGPRASLDEVPMVLGGVMDSEASKFCNPSSRTPFLTSLCAVGDIHGSETTPFLDGSPVCF